MTKSQTPRQLTIEQQREKKFLEDRIEAAFLELKQNPHTPLSPYYQGIQRRIEKLATDYESLVGRKYLRTHNQILTSGDYRI